MFIKSGYYNALTKFGQYCIDTKVINIEEYIKWLIKLEIHLPQWAKDTTYNKFLQYYIFEEKAQSALTRSIEYAINWSEISKVQPHDIFRYGSLSRLCFAIQTGKISPWMLYQSDSGNELLTKLNQEQLQLVWDVIHPDIWTKKFNKNKNDVLFAKEMLTRGGW